jgi:hypothetical protein
MEIKVTLEKKVIETKSYELAEEFYKKDAVEIFQIKVVNGTPTIKGIYIASRGNYARVQQYKEKEIEKILNLKDAKKEEFDEYVSKLVSFATKWHVFNIKDIN